MAIIDDRFETLSVTIHVCVSRLTYVDHYVTLFSSRSADDSDCKRVTYSPKTNGMTSVVYRTESKKTEDYGRIRL